MSLAELIAHWNQAPAEQPSTETAPTPMLAPPPNAHQELCQRIFGQAVPAPHFLPASSWTARDKWGQLLNQRMMELEYEYCQALIEEQREQGVDGAIVEFGVFSGGWLERLIAICEVLQLRREVWGFDSFEGLPETSADDLACFAKGQFAADYESVRARLKVAERPYVHLEKGWFCDTLPRPTAQSIQRIAFARIDCDLYEPTCECLDYLTYRLVNGAILVFDDWTFRADKGETKAFFAWAERVTHLRFEFLCYNSIGHLYTRVHRSV